MGCVVGVGVGWLEEQSDLASIYQLKMEVDCRGGLDWDEGGGLLNKPRVSFPVIVFMAEKSND